MLFHFRREVLKNQDFPEFRVVSVEFEKKNL